FDGKPPETLRFGSPWPEGNFTWVSKTTEVAPGFQLILLQGTWGADLEVKEISLAIDTPDGIVLIVGCSHPTIEKIVEAASTLNKPIHLVLGGTHLLPATNDQISSIAASLHDKWSIHPRARLRHSERDVWSPLCLCGPRHDSFIGAKGYCEGRSRPAGQKGNGRGRLPHLSPSDDARTIPSVASGRQQAACASGPINSWGMRGALSLLPYPRPIRVRFAGR